jgi:hypothetical protein
MVHRNVQNTHRPTKSSLTLVIKVGTSSICDEKTHFPLLGNLSMIVETIIKLKSLGHRVVLVTSAAVGTGLRRLNMSSKPSKLASVQVKHVSNLPLGYWRARQPNSKGPKLETLVVARVANTALTNEMNKFKLKRLSFSCLM